MKLFSDSVLRKIASHKSALNSIHGDRSAESAICSVDHVCADVNVGLATPAWATDGMHKSTDYGSIDTNDVGCSLTDRSLSSTTLDGANIK